MQGFEQSSKVRIFADCGKRVKRFDATALAAPVSKLRELAAAIEKAVAKYGSCDTLWFRSQVRTMARSAKKTVTAFGECFKFLCLNSAWDLTDE